METSLLIKTRRAYASTVVLGRQHSRDAEHKNGRTEGGDGDMSRLGIGRACNRILSKDILVSLFTLRLPLLTMEIPEIWKLFLLLNQYHR